MAKAVETEQKQINIIGAGTSINGDINCSGDIRIDGTLVGNMNVQGKIVIGTSGTIKGEITCKNSEVEGKVEGKITVHELLSLKGSSAIYGDIITKKIAVEPGATFTGNCQMGKESLLGSQPLHEEKKK